MKSLLSSVFAIMLSVFAMSPAMAQDTVPASTPAPEQKFSLLNLGGEEYWGVSLGEGFQPSETNRRGDATYLSAKYGTDLGLYDVELEGFRSFTSGKPWIGNVDVLGVMVNGKAKYKNTSNFTPYVKLGAGVGLFDDYGVRDDGVHFLFSGGVGTTYKLSDGVDLDLAYNRMWSPADVRSNGWGYDNYQQDVVSLGVNFKVN